MDKKKINSPKLTENFLFWICGVRRNPDRSLRTLRFVNLLIGKSMYRRASSPVRNPANAWHQPCHATKPTQGQPPSAQRGVQPSKARHPCARFWVAQSLQRCDQEGSRKSRPAGRDPTTRDIPLHASLISTTGHKEINSRKLTENFLFWICVLAA